MHILMTTYNRPDHFERAARTVAKLRAPVLVVDDGSTGEAYDRNRKICMGAGFGHLWLPANRGLAAAMNIGLAFLLADSRIRWISYLQDDVEIREDALEILAKFQDQAPLITGHDAKEHAAHSEAMVDGWTILKKRAIRATHMHAAAEFWSRIYPIPTRELGAPKRTGAGRGLGSNVDWWIVRDAPASIQKTGSEILCIPGIVRTFLWEGKDSCWNNTQRCGPDDPLRS